MAKTDTHPSIAAILALKQGPYLTPDAADIQGEETMDIEMGTIGVTDAKSCYPVLGTSGLATCMAVLVYDRSRKRAGCYHDYAYHPQDIDTLLHAVRGDSTRPVEVYVLGCNNRVSARFEGVSEEDVRADEARQKQVLEHIAAQPGCRIICADIDTKPHPEGAYLDTRTGLLVRDGQDMTIELNPYDEYIMWSHPEKDRIQDKHYGPRGKEGELIVHDFSTEEYALGADERPRTPRPSAKAAAISR